MQNPRRFFHPHRRHSFEPLIAIVVVIGLSNLLSFTLQMTSFLFQGWWPSSPVPGLSWNRVQFAATVLFGLIGFIVWWVGSQRIVRRLILVYTALATAVLVLSLVSLVGHIGSYKPAQALTLLVDAMVVWVMTVLTFALWYWLMDSGWPEMMLGDKNNRVDFLFPQYSNELPGWEQWAPHYLDYLHLAFNTSTAFSPADVSPLSQRAKMLMLVQSSLSLVVIVTLLARAINMLASG